MPIDSTRVEADLGSFRDPAGHVYHFQGRIFRTVMAEAADRFERLQRTGALQRLIDDGRLWPAFVLNAEKIPSSFHETLSDTPAFVLEHPPLPFVSYPYEWPFKLLKRAALLHLDFQLQALSEGFNVSDGSAYNVQFVNVKPVFIDTLSLVPYEDGDYWLGYRQFCEQFVNPLLLMAKVGIPYHAWYRGALEGITVEHMAQVLPWHARLSWGLLAHVFLHERLTRKAFRNELGARKNTRGLSKRGLIGFLTGLKSLISGLEPKNLKNTTWGDYNLTTSYQPEEARTKSAFVSDFSEKVRPDIMWDLGCNNGEHSQLALAAGSKQCIGFDFDLGALEGAADRAIANNLNLLPLVLDATNPSPNQGWAQRERAGLAERSNADGVIALAFFHHLVIGKNIPMEQAMDWIVGLAPSGVIEFVPKADPMVQVMLASRSDIFEEYDIEVFRNLLRSRSKIVKEEKVSTNGRTLFWFYKKN